MRYRTGVAALILALGGALLAAGACATGTTDRVKGSGVSKTETRDVEAFRAVRLDGAADVNITVGDKTEVTVTADDNVLPVIETEVRDGKLVIGNRESYDSKTGVKVTIVTPSLDGFELNGSGDVTIKGLKDKSFSIAIRGSGDLTAYGAVDTVKASIAGSGDLKLADVKAKSADISISGSGTATVNAADALTATIAGSGDVRYTGDPKVKSSVAGSGRVKRA